MLAFLTAGVALGSLLWPDHPGWLEIAIDVLVAGVILLVGERIKRGSRAAAVGLFTVFVVWKLVLWVAGATPLRHGALVTVVVIFCLAQGVWGTYSLATVRRERAADPGAESPTSRQAAV